MQTHPGGSNPVRPLAGPLHPAFDAAPDPQALLPTRGGTAAASNKPSLTITQAAEQITRLDASLNGYGALGTAAAVTYAFRSTAPTAMPDDTSGFSRFSDAQIAATIAALSAWSDVANITFTRVTAGGADAYSDSATMLFGNYSAGAAGAAAFAYFPGSADPASVDSDLWVNSTLSYNSTPTLWRYGQTVLVHEIGHALGLSHPADYNAGNGPITYAADATYSEDTRQYSIMSYFQEGSDGSGVSYSGAYAAAPQLDDIAAAQRLYGANTSTRTGDTTYGFHSTAGRDWYSATDSSSTLIFAAWDAGGEDTFDFSGYSVNQKIDLRQGAFSDVGGLTGNVAVAQNCEIEDAVGGSGDDEITGNALGNKLTGGAGADKLYGGAGDDILSGDGTMAGSQNLLDGGDGEDAASYASSAGRVYADIGAATAWTVGRTGSFVALDRYTSIEDLVGGAFDDTLVGGASANLIAGGAGADLLYGLAGDDTLMGGATPAGQINQLWGGDGNDTASYKGTASAVIADLRAFSGWLIVGGVAVVTDAYNSIEGLTGGDGDDIFIGDAGANTIDGAAGADALYGMDGNDTLIGGSTTSGHFNQLWGGNGCDTASYQTIARRIYADLGGGYGQIDNGAGAMVVADSYNSIENLTGGSADDTLVGDAGANVIDGLAGADCLYGMDGDDVLCGNVAPSGQINQLWGGNGVDTASYAFATTRVYADLNVQAGWIDNGAGALVLNDCYNSIEALKGGSGDDTLLGDAGADVISGGAGRDTLYANLGAAADASVDRFVYSRASDSNVSGYDTIVNFKSGQDKLDFTAFHIGSAAVLIQSGAAATSVYANTDGIAGYDLALVVVGANAVTIGDVLL